MKESYKCGEILLALREEYRDCKHLLEKLNQYINIKEKNSNFYFTGLLSEHSKTEDLEDRKIRLFVEKKCLNVLKKIESLKYDWYSRYLYSAFFNVEKEKDGLYGLKYDDVFTPVDGRKYIPEVEVVDKKNFSSNVEQLLSTDLMKTKKGNFNNNHESVFLDFDNGHISTSLGGDGSFIEWDGINDKFNYSINSNNSSALLEDVLSLEIPAYKISPDWLKLLKKHENIYDKELFFDVDENAHSKKGILEISDIKRNSDYSIVKLLKK